MKIALCTTTIHVPHALKLLRKCGPGVRFFIACDKKTPGDIAIIVDSDTKLLTETMQGDWECSAALPWNSMSRRNIAFLEALKWGADVIYSWDDDNLIVDSSHWAYIYNLLEHNFRPTTALKFNGIKVSNLAGWFDPGSLLIPGTRQRGMPWNQRAANWAESVTDAKVGVVSGLIVGDPDCDASTRIEKAPDIGSVHVLGQAGVVVDPKTLTIFNSQNTTIIRELIPAFFLMPGVGRHDDIYASLIVQRVMRERGYHVHLGQPFCYQARNPHNLITDLRAEIDGMENVEKLAALLDSIILPARSVIEDTRIIYKALYHCDFLPTTSVEAGLLWLDDCAEVL